MDTLHHRPDRREPLGETVTRVNIHKPIIHKPLDASATKRQSIDLFAALPPVPSLPPTIDESEDYRYNDRRYSQIRQITDTPPVKSKRFSQISATSNTSSSSRRKTHVGPWRLGRTLGKGASGRVRLAKHSQTGQFAAVKIVAKKAAALVQSKSMAFAAEALEDDAKDRRLPLGIEREVVIMKLIDHPNVMRLYDVWENRGELYIVLEYIEGGELFTYLSKRGRLPEEEAVHYFRQIISGLSYCHKFGICHRDLKPENLLLDATQNTIKIADFGMAALQPRGKLLETSCGSPHYAAPEIIRGQPYRGEMCDIWSCGVILFALLAGYLPFDDEDIRILLKKVKLGRFEMPRQFSDDAKGLIWRMLELDPRSRITMDEIWQHPLIKKYENKVPIINGHYLPTGRWQGLQPHPSAGNAGRPVKNRNDIDGEIFRNLHTLWYGEKKEDIIQRLLSPEQNEEKLFYQLLLKFKHSQQENYNSSDISHSASDKHHHRMTSIPSDPMLSPQIEEIPAVPPLPDFHRISACLAPAREDSTLSTADTVLSYDAFRLSDGFEDMNAEGSKMALIEALKDSTALTPRWSSNSTAFKSTNHLRTRHQLDSCISVADSMKSTRSAKRRVGTRKIGSKASFSTVTRLNDPSRKSVSQAVSRPGSISSRSIHKTKKAPRFVLQSKNHGTNSSLSQTLAGTPLQGASPSPSAYPLPVPRRPTTANSQKAKSRISYIHTEEARKVSAELEALCEEVFNPSSEISTILTGADSDLPRITPSSSISSLSDTFLTAEDFTGTADAVQLPDVIADTKPSAYPEADSPMAQHPMAQDVRFRVVQKLREQSAANRSKGSRVNNGFRNVIARLDSFTQTPATGRRAVSTPAEGRPLPALNSPLPIITEERPLAETADALQRGHRAASAPGFRGYDVRPSPMAHERGFRPGQPIRIVDVQPPNVTNIPPPLRVRKRAKNSTGPFHNSLSPPPPAVPERSQSRPLPRPPITDMIPPEIPQRRSFHPLESNPVYPVTNLPGSPGSYGPSTPSPFQGSQASVRPASTPSWLRSTPNSTSAYSFVTGHDTLDPPSKANGRQSPFGQSRPISLTRDDDLTRNLASAPPKRLSGVSEKWSFIKRLAKQATSRGGNKASETDEGGFSLDSQSCRSQTSSEADSVNAGWTQPKISNEFNNFLGLGRFQAAVPEQHWLARLFHVKPATRTVCLKIGSQRTRREIMKALNNWYKYGMLDVIEDANAGIITGRVGEQNFLNIKPVSFRIDIFPVKEITKDKKFSIIKITQVAGAASSMHKVVDTLETVLESKSFVIKSRKRIRQMGKLLN